jgi:hypothetical protein
MGPKNNRFMQFPPSGNVSNKRQAQENMTIFQDYLNMAGYANALV